jgi:hypothetical protein
MVCIFLLLRVRIGLLGGKGLLFQSENEKESGIVLSRLSTIVKILPIAIGTG